MAKQLGFFVLDTEVQPIVWPEDDDPRPAARSPRGMRYDLLPIGSRRDAAPALPRLVGGLSHALPDVAQRTADAWRTVGSELGPFYTAIQLTPMADGRNPLVEELREAALDLGVEGGW